MSDVKHTDPCLSVELISQCCIVHTTGCSTRGQCPLAEEAEKDGDCKWSGCVHSESCGWRELHVTLTLMMCQSLQQH